MQCHTVHRLRNLLHQGKLHGHYFKNDGRHRISREFWATAEADGSLESGTYWPFGRPSRIYEQRPNYPLFLLQSELDTLLNGEPAKRRPFPRSRIPELVAALRELEDLPNRKHSTTHYASYRNFASLRSRVLISVKRPDKCHASADVNRDENS